MMVQKQCTLSRNCSWNFEFESFPRLAMCSTILPRDAGRAQCCSHMIVRVNHDTLTTILFFTLSMVFNQLQKVFNPLLENRFCVR